jgi:hypothetical protein
MNKFSNITIRGRYIYGYLCISNMIPKYNLPSLPDKLNQTIKTFTISVELDEWLLFAEEVIPSTVLENYNNEKYFEHFLISDIIELREYYVLIPDQLLNIIEELIRLGISNIFAAYNSEDSMPHIMKIIEIMNTSNTDLPNFEIISDCIIKNGDGWGNECDMEKYLPDGLDISSCSGYASN